MNRPKHQGVAEAVERKRRSEMILQARAIPINPRLAPLRSSLEVVLRSADEVARRCATLCVIASCAEPGGMSVPMVRRILKARDLDDTLSPQEQRFLKSKNPTDEQRARFTWRYESAWVLLWALGRVKGLGDPADVCDATRAVRLTLAEDFLLDPSLRPPSAILDEADLHWRMHWAVADALLNDRPAPPGLDPDVVYERHHAFNWLMGQAGPAWDEADE